MADALYDIGIRLGLETSAFTLGMSEAVQAFNRLQQTATSADATVSRFGPRLDRSFSSMQQSAQRASAAYDALNQSQTRLDMGGTTMAQHAAKIDAANRAQSAFNTQQDRYNQLLAQQKQATEEAASAQERYNRAQQGFGLMAAGGILTAAGASVFGWMKNATQQAMDLQTVMTGIGTALTNPQGQRLAPSVQQAALAALQQQEIAIGARNQMSVEDVANIVQAATAAGMTQPSVLLGSGWQSGNFQGGILPGLANFSEVLKMRRGYTPEESATVAAEFAHLFGAWSPDAFNQMVNTLGRALFVSPATPEQFRNLTSQFAGILRPLEGTVRGKNGQPVTNPQFISDAILMTALESEMGQATRGGTQFAQIVARALGVNRGGTAARGQQARALADIQRISGINFFNPKTGRINSAQDFIEALGAYAGQGGTPQQIGLELQQAFGMVGNRQAGLLADPIVQKRLATLATMFSDKGLPSMESIQQAYNKTPQGQLNQATKNWQTFTTLVGQQLLPALSSVAVALAKVTAFFVQIAAQHPVIVQIAAVFAVLAGAVALVSGPILMIGGAILILKSSIGTVRDLAAAFRGLAGAEEAAAAASTINEAGGAGAGGAALAGAGRAAAGGATAAEGAEAAAAGGAALGLSDLIPLAGVAVVVGALGAAGLDWLLHHGAGSGKNGGAGGPSGKKAVDALLVHPQRDYMAIPGERIMDGYYEHPGPGGTWVRDAPVRRGYGNLPNGGNVQQHINHVDIHVQTHPNQNPHQIAAATKEALKEIGNGFALDANYGGYAFTSNPTLRSAGQ